MTTEPKSTTSQKIREPLSGGRRIFLFLSTYILGALIVTIISIALDAADERYRLKDFLDAFLLLFPSFILFLPWGVLPALEWISKHIFARPLTLLNVHAGPFPEPANIFATLLMVLSYILFFALVIAGTRNDKAEKFRNLYFMFIFWVILNAGGCLVNPPG